MKNLMFGKVHVMQIKCIFLEYIHACYTFCIFISSLSSFKTYYIYHGNVTDLINMDQWTSKMWPLNKTREEKERTNTDTLLYTKCFAMLMYAFMCVCVFKSS